MAKLPPPESGEGIPPPPPGFVPKSSLKQATPPRRPPPPPGFVPKSQVVKPAEAPAPAGFRYVDDPLNPVTESGKVGRGLQPIPERQTWGDRAREKVGDAVSYLAAPATQSENPAVRTAGQVGEMVATGLGQWPVTLAEDPVKAGHQARQVLDPVVSFEHGQFAWMDAVDAAKEGDWPGAAGKGLEALTGYAGAAASLIPGAAGARQLATQPVKVAPREVLGALATEALDAPVRPQALDAISRILVHSGVPRDRINSGLGRVVDSLKEATGRAATVAQLLQREFGEEFPQVVENVETVVRERGLSRKAGDASPTIVRQTAQQMRESQTPFIEGSARRNLGGEAVAPSRQASEASQVDRIAQSARANLGADARGLTQEQMEARLRALGREGYEPLLEQTIDPQRAERIQAILNGPGMGELMRPLRQIAAGEGVDIARMIEREPLRAAHWMQHKARLLAEDQAGKSDTLAGAYNSMRSRILRQLDDLQAPDGRSYAQLRADYGDEAGISQALNAGNRFGAETANPEGARRFLQEYRGMTQPQQQAALASIRDWVMQKVSGGQEGAPARIAELTTRGVLEALDAIGGGAANLARDLRSIRDDAAFWEQTSATTRDFGSIALSPERSAAFIQRFETLTPQQQQATLAAVREWVQQRLRGSGEDAPARIAELSKLGVLDTLDQMGSAGAGLADDIRAIRSENQFLRRVTNDGQSATMPNAVALEEGPNLYSRKGASSLPMNVMADAGLMMAGMSTAPVLTALRQGPKLYSGIMRPRTRTREDMTRVLMARQREAADPPAQRGNALLPPGAAGGAAPVSQIGSPVSPNSPNSLLNPASTPEQAGFTPNALLAPAVTGSIGATAGYNADPEASQEERIRNAFLGAAAGAAGGYGAARMSRGVARPDVAQDTFAGQFGAKNLAGRGEVRPQQALEMAEQMAARGASREEIWSATSKHLEGTNYAGVSRGPDGEWRFEIDDSGVQFNPGVRKAMPWDTLRLRDVVSDADAGGAYPELGDIRVKTRNYGLPGGAYRPREPGHAEEFMISAPDRTAFEQDYGSGSFDRLPPAAREAISDPVETARRTVLHERQHAIQDGENFAAGGNRDQFRRAEVDRAAEDLFASDQSAPGSVSWKSADKATKERYRERARNELYRRLAGEVEARNVETRRDFTPEQRRATPPWETQGIPDEQQIVRRGDGRQDSIWPWGKGKKPETPAKPSAPAIEQPASSPPSPPASRAPEPAADRASFSRVIDLDMSSVPHAPASVRVVKNPTKRDMARLSVIPMEERASMGGGRTTPLRYVTDERGDLYVWRGDVAIHDDVIRQLGIYPEPSARRGMMDREVGGMIEVRDGEAYFDGRKTPEWDLDPGDPPPAPTSPRRASLQGGTPEALERARAQGFDVDTPLYHGTLQKIEGDHLRPSNEGSYGRGVYFSTRPEEADMYAGAVDGLPAMDGSVIPVFGRGKMATGRDLAKVVESLRSRGITGDAAEEAAGEILAQQGFAGLRVGSEVVIFDPKNIRSRFAKFDPAKSDSSNLLAGLPIAGTAGIASLLLSPEAEAQTGPLPLLTDAAGAAVEDQLPYRIVAENRRQSNALLEQAEQSDQRYASLNALLSSIPKGPPVRYKRTVDPLADYDYSRAYDPTYEGYRRPDRRDGAGGR